MPKLPIDDDVRALRSTNGAVWQRLADDPGADFWRVWVSESTPWTYSELDMVSTFGPMTEVLPDGD